jgi:hypothetical protein
LHKYTSIKFLSVRGFSSFLFLTTKKKRMSKKKNWQIFVCYLFPIPTLFVAERQKKLSKKQKMMVQYKGNVNFEYKNFANLNVIISSLKKKF